jgi:membrane carboxypeptidase/penicillin-binding protein
MKTGADGSVLAGPIFHKFIDKALANTPNEDFVKPDGITEVEVDKFSNKLPSQYSQERTKDIFASWQVPTDQDNVHFGARFCKGTNKLAPDGMPDSLIETRVYNIIHSERPDNPNW